MTPTLTVTGLQLETKSVTIDAPHGDLLARAAAALARWQGEADQAAAEMVRLRDAGVFLDPDGAPVLLSWWARSDRPSHYLIWPTRYARQTGIARRQSVKAGEYRELEATRKRTLEYANLKARYDRLRAKITRAGEDLAHLAERFDW